MVSFKIIPKISTQNRYVYDNIWCLAGSGLELFLKWIFF